MPELNVPLNFTLHGNQELIQARARKFNVIKAGKRFGKTKLAIYRSLQKAGHLPGGVVWYVAPTYKQAKEIAWWELIKILPPQMIRRKVETDLVIEIYNECRLKLVGADNEDSLRGPKMHHVTLDEAAYLKEHIWPTIIAGQLLGNEEEGGTGTADFISSPNKDGRNWFTEFHSDAMKKMEAGDPDWAAFYFTIYDNPTLKKEDIDKLKDQMSDDKWNLEYMAQESLLSGLWFPEFNYGKHVGAIDLAAA